jgi:hypothetical protein
MRLNALYRSTSAMDHHCRRPMRGSALARVVEARPVARPAAESGLRSWLDAAVQALTVRDSVSLSVITCRADAEDMGVERENNAGAGRPRLRQGNRKRHRKWNCLRPEETRGSHGGTAREA